MPDRSTPIKCLPNFLQATAIVPYPQSATLADLLVVSAWGTYCSPASPNIRRNHEYILVWQKGEKSLKNNRGIPSDLSKEDWNQSIYSVWEIKPETAKRKEHSAPFPDELVRRLIKLYSFPQDLILDPFNGTGTTTTVCAAQNRRWLGIDLSPDYCQKAKERTEKAYQEWMKMKKIRNHVINILVGKWVVINARKIRNPYCEMGVTNILLPIGMAH